MTYPIGGEEGRERLTYPIGGEEDRELMAYPYGGEEGCERERRSTALIDGLADGKSTLGGGEICLSETGDDKIALIFDSGAARSYSSTRLAKSSSDLTEIKVSKSPFGN